MNTEPTICGVCGRDIGEERVNGICKECFEKVTSGEQMKITDKHKCRKLATNGYVYGGYWDGLHHFSRRVPGRPGVYVVRVPEKALHNGDAQYCMEHDLTR